MLRNCKNGVKCLGEDAKLDFCWCHKVFAVFRGTWDVNEAFLRATSHAAIMV